MKKTFLFLSCLILVLSSCGKKPSSDPKNQELPDNVIEGTVVRLWNSLVPSAYSQDIVICNQDIIFCAKLMDSESEDILAETPVVDGKFKFKLDHPIDRDRLYKIVVTKKDDPSYLRSLVIAGAEGRFPINIDPESTLTYDIKRDLLKKKYWDLRRNAVDASKAIKEIKEEISSFQAKLTQIINETGSELRLNERFKSLLSDYFYDISTIRDTLSSLFVEFKKDQTLSSKKDEIKAIFTLEEVGYLSIQEDLSPLVSLFEQRSIEQGKPIKIASLIIKMEEIEAKILGKCIPVSFGNPYKTIKMNSKYWDYLSDEGREQAVFHYLGQCVLGRGHRSDFQTILGTQIPLSIMNPYHFNSSWYIANYEHYMHELFTEEDLESALPLKPYSDSFE